VQAACWPFADVVRSQVTTVEHFAERSAVAYGVVAGMKGTPVEVQVRRGAETLRASTRPLPAIEAGMAMPPRNWYDLLSRLQFVLNDDPAILVIDSSLGLMSRVPVSMGSSSRCGTSPSPGDRS